jgi:hypothetical protein
MIDLTPTVPEHLKSKLRADLQQAYKRVKEQIEQYPDTPDNKEVRATLESKLKHYTRIAERNGFTKDK